MDLSNSLVGIRSVPMNINLKIWDPNGCFLMYFIYCLKSPLHISYETMHYIQLKLQDKFLVCPLHAQCGDWAGLGSSPEDMSYS